jgi:hypothetical protein
MTFRSQICAILALRFIYQMRILRTSSVAGKRFQQKESGMFINPNMYFEEIFPPEEIVAELAANPSAAFEPAPLTGSIEALVPDLGALPEAA